AIIRDLSEKKRNEDLLKKSEQLAMIGQLAAGVAHEIRNPLTTLKGFLQLMKENAEGDFYLGVIQGELDRIEIITNEFLA
ncbi:histidine kinase dimerization/phospho-acceptor domain-containing protein, partial [Planococcus sp. SIMBA_143]